MSLTTLFMPRVAISIQDKERTRGRKRPDFDDVGEGEPDPQESEIVFDLCPFHGRVATLGLGSRKCNVSISFSIRTDPKLPKI